MIPNLILKSFGSEINGLVSSITQYLGFIAILDLGVGAVIQTAYYEPIAKQNHKTVSLIFKESKVFFRKIAYCLLLYIGILCFYFTHLSNNEFDGLFTINLITCISISTFAQYYFSIPYDLLINAEQRYYYQSNIQIILVSINILISAVLIKVGYSIQIVKLATSIIYIIKPFMTYAYVKTNFNIIKVKKEERIRIDQKWNGMAQHIATVIMNNMDFVLLTSFTSFVLVSVYSVYNMVLMGVRALLLSLSNGFNSYLGDIYARKEIESLRCRFGVFEWIYNVLVTVVFSVTLLLIVPFVSLYTQKIDDNIIYIQKNFAVLITFAQALYCIRIPYNTMICAAGHYKQTQLSAIIEVILNMGISLILVFNYGLMGVAIGTLVAIMYRTIYFVFYLKQNIVGLQIKNTLKLLLSDIICGILIIVICINVRRFIVPEKGVLSWIASAIIFVIVAMTIELFANRFLFKDYVYSFFNLIRKRK